jgi:hypothetical protein
VGTIRWPLSLHEDAADLDYVNDNIQTALYDAYSSVFDILTGRRQHPILDLLSAYRANVQDKRVEANSDSNSTYNDLFDPALDFKFSVPILPGDASLADKFISNLKTHIRHLCASLVEDDDIIHISQALFRPADSNCNIFELVKDGRVSRIWTDHEQALAACYGESDTRPTASFSTRPDPLVWNIKTVMDSELEPLHSRPLVTIQGSVVWTSRPGLTSGPLKPQCYKPPHLRLLEPGPGPRLKPRPARRRPASKEVSTRTAPSIGAKRPSNMMADIEIPAAKSGKANNTMLDHGTLEDRVVEDPDHAGGSANVRRGQRQRNPVKF